jgi:hypothetical protein
MDWIPSLFSSSGWFFRRGCDEDLSPINSICDHAIAKPARRQSLLEEGRVPTVPSLRSIQSVGSNRSNHLMKHTGTSGMFGTAGKLGTTENL